MAWPSDRRPSDADTYYFIPELWATRVINHVRSYLVSKSLVNTTWKDQLAMGDKVTIPVLKELSTYDVDVTSTAAIPGSLNTSMGAGTATVTIDHWKEAPVIIDDSVKRQTQIKDLLNLEADNAAYALEKVVDSGVCALFSGLNSAVRGVYGSDGQTFTDDILIAMMEVLDEDDIPRENRSLIGDPSTLADCYKIDKFMNFDYTTKPLGGMDGYRGTINAYNIPFYVTNHLTASTSIGNVGCLLHRDAIGLVIQSGPDVEKWRHPAAHSDVINISVMYGEDEIRDLFGYAFHTRKS